VLPTRVGVNRGKAVANPAPMRAPHARGGEPRETNTRRLEVRCSPRAWG